MVYVLPVLQLWIYMYVWEKNAPNGCPVLLGPGDKDPNFVGALRMLRPCLPPASRILPGLDHARRLH